jgi:hypothetical protein
MKTTVSICDFRDAFKKLGANNFSYEGLTWIFEYLEEYENSSNEEIELDVVAICCDFNESTYEEVQEMYSLELDTDLSVEDRNKSIRDFLSDAISSVVGFDDEKVLFHNF